MWIWTKGPVLGEKGTVWFTFGHLYPGQARDGLPSFLAVNHLEGSVRRGCDSPQGFCGVRGVLIRSPRSYLYRCPSLTPLGPQSRFGDRRRGIRVVCLQQWHCSPKRVSRIPVPASDRLFRCKPRALSVRVSYQAASTGPCGIHLVVPQARSTKQCPLLLSKQAILYVLLIRTQPKNVNHNA